MAVERVSIELSNRCGKRCHFCYNHSNPQGATAWTPEEVVGFVEDLADHGTRAVSFGGGEPLEYEGVFEVLGRLKGRLFRSLTTNGLPLGDEALFDRLIEAAPDKVHVSIHFPGNEREVDRVLEQVLALQGAGVTSGVNLLVSARHLEACGEAAARLREAGVGNERIVYLPVRGVGAATPTPRQLGQVAGSMKFQSMSCLLGCGKSPRFCSVGFDREVSWCSYTVSRRPLRALTAAALFEALEGLPLRFCGEEGRS